MGLDISARLDNQEELFGQKEFDELMESSNLSRTFCNFMCRRNVVKDCQPELDQLGDLTGVDINFLYEMEGYTQEWQIDEMLEFEENEEEKEKQKEIMLKRNGTIENNIERVKNRLTQLLQSIEKIPDLPNKLEKTAYDTLGISTYISDFKNNPGDGYIGNNLGQDFRNLLKLVEFGSQNQSKTVYFEYG